MQYTWTDTHGQIGTHTAGMRSGRQSHTVNSVMRRQQKTNQNDGKKEAKKQKDNKGSKRTEGTQ